MQVSLRKYNKMQDISANELKPEELTETTAPSVALGPNLDVPPVGFEISNTV